MKLKRTAVLLCVGMLGIMTAVTGCGTENTDTTSAQTANEEAPGADTTETTGTVESDTQTEETSIRGQISAIDGNSITIALAEKPERGDEPQGGEKPEQQNEKAPDSSTEAPSDQKEPPEVDKKDSAESMPLTGDEQTVTVDADTVITVNGETTEVDALNKDDMVTVILNGDRVISITTEDMSQQPPKEPAGTES